MKFTLVFVVLEVNSILFQTRRHIILVDSFVFDIFLLRLVASVPGIFSIAFIVLFLFVVVVVDLSMMFIRLCMWLGTEETIQ